MKRLKLVVLLLPSHMPQAAAALGLVSMQLFSGQYEGQTTTSNHKHISKKYFFMIKAFIKISSSFV